MSKINIIPLGGLREIGKNMYVVEVEDDLFILDAGLMYPEGDQYGIDSVISDFTYLEQNRNRIAGIFLTHGHDDAVGALPYLLDEIKVPVFGSELTIRLAKYFVKQANLDIQFDDYHMIDEHTVVEFENTEISFFKTTHTIPDSYGICLKTNEGSIVYTGDFKFDQSHIPNYETDLAKISEIGNNGVLALLSDSTNADSSYENATEIHVKEEVKDTIKNSDKRIVVAAVASNILRIQQVIHAAYDTNRKIYIEDEHAKEIIRITESLGKLDIPDENIFIEKNQLSKYEADETIILIAGSPANLLSTLNDLSMNKHKTITLDKHDLVFFVTSPSVAMEVEIADIENRIYRTGARVLSLNDEIKASGHGTPTELKTMINLLNPKYLIPVQGDYSMLAHHGQLGHETGIPHENIFIVSNGDMVKYEKGKMRVSEQVPAANVMVDGIGIGDVGNIVLRDRRILSEDGVFVAVVTINRKSKQIISDPQIISRGFVFVKESTELIQESEKIVKDTVNEVLQNKKFDWGVLKKEIRDALEKYLFKETSRRPIILPIIMEAKK